MTKVKPKVGEIWLIQGGNCQDLVLVTNFGEGFGLDCSDYPGLSGVMWFGEAHIIRRIQEAENGK